MMWILFFSFKFICNIKNIWVLFLFTETLSRSSWTTETNLGIPWMKYHEAGQPSPVAFFGVMSQKHRYMTTGVLWIDKRYKQIKDFITLWQPVRLWEEAERRGRELSTQAEKPLMFPVFITCCSPISKF